MLAKTHLLSSVAIASPALMYLQKEQFLFFLMAVALGALSPDLDEQGSYLSRKISFISFLISIFTTHRGVTHTLLAAIVLLASSLGILFFYQMQSFNYIAYGFAIGYVAHILGDMSTRSGVALLYPFYKKNLYVLPKSLRYVTGGIIERTIILPLFAISLILINYHFSAFDELIKEIR